MENKLHKPVFTPLYTQEIKPEGWLLNQLKIQAQGLSGNLDKFWPDIKDSKWIGGSADGWERMPYWLDGFIPLAWLLDDEELKERARFYVEYIMENQEEDGWLCPKNTGDRSRYDLWALFLMLKVLVGYYNATLDDRTQKVVRKALMALDRHIDGNVLFNWGQTRWFESLISIWWLYDRTGEDWLLRLATKLHGQGFDWLSFFKYHWPYEQPEERGRWSQMSHVVNNAMMLKSGALLWRMTGEEEHLHSAEKMVNLLDQYHGMVTGVFTGDECLAGKSPIQGTELCAVGEYMFSLENLLAITGRSHWGDRLELIAFNPLPATFSPDMWTHQYDQQVNQVECSRQVMPVFLTNGGDANLFGLEPHFGCCTANLSQPWPKFAQSLFMRSEDGLAAVAYAPCSVRTRIGEADVSIRLETGYPFRDSLYFKVNTDREVRFTLWLRIPGWAQNPYIDLEGRKIPLSGGAFYPLKGKWIGETAFTLKLPMRPQLVSRPNGLYAITRGPLVYSLPIGERWVRINEDVPGREYPHCDYEVYPTTPWNYGLCLDPRQGGEEIIFEERPIGECPFSPEGAPIRAYVKGKKIDWQMRNGAAEPFPSMEWVSDELEDLCLIPYGCTNLRMTEMPLLKP